MRVVKMLLAVASVFTVLVCCMSGSLAWLALMALSGAGAAFILARRRKN